MEISASLISVSYLVAGVLFILSLGGLSAQTTARRGNGFGIVGMLLAVAITALGHVSSFGLLAAAIAVGAGIGALLASRVAMTAMPELVAVLHSFVGLAAVLVGIASYLGGHQVPGSTEVLLHEIEIFVGVFVGALTFTGSIIAFFKLRGSIGSKPWLLPGRHPLNAGLVGVCVVLALRFVGVGAEQGLPPLLIMTGIAGFLGVHVVMAIGGADMPVVVSMLNSYSGWAAAAAGFMLSNDLLIITGALVGSSGAILSYIMCKAMNRSFLSVIFGGFGADEGKRPAKAAEGPQGEVTSVTAPETASLLRSARNVVSCQVTVWRWLTLSTRSSRLRSFCARAARTCASRSTRWRGVCPGT
jgi:H+-translocating NAD(P) transhydrogenase subunit beta